jgi:hypothetical protein
MICGTVSFTPDEARWLLGVAEGVKAVVEDWHCLS